MAMVIPPPAAAKPDYSGCHPLICDPFLGNRRLLRDALKDIGCSDIEHCLNISELWKHIEKGGPNLVFLDWSGETDALTFLLTIRTPRHPQRFLPLVVMTAYDGLDYIFAARDAGATEFMLRPWSNMVLESRLRSVVQHPRLFIDGGPFFGPDRRRRRVAFAGPERRSHENWCSGDRRNAADLETGDWEGRERRQGRPGYAPLERRGGFRL